MPRRGRPYSRRFLTGSHIVLALLQGESTLFPLPGVANRANSNNLMIEKKKDYYTNILHSIACVARIMGSKGFLQTH